MKLNKIVILFFLLVFGYLTSSLRNEIILKTDLSDVNSNLLNLILKIDFISGFIYPFAFYTFFYLLFSFSSYIVVEKKVKNLGDIIMFSMIPNLIFIILNYNYILDMNSNDIEDVIVYKTRAIIPFIGFEFSALISNYIVYFFPSLFLFIYLIYKEKISFLNSFFISLLPLIIVFLTYNFLL